MCVFSQGAKRSRKQKASVKRMEGSVESLAQNAPPKPGRAGARAGGQRAEREDGGTSER